MQECILAGCDLHDKTMLVKVAEGRGEPEKYSWTNTPGGRGAMVKKLQQLSLRGKKRVIFAYEASGQGFGLHDELREAGIECYVLAPTKMAKSAKGRRSKTDEKDAELILEVLRGHVLAGNRLPSVWVPDKETRDDREVVRARLDVSEKMSSVKVQVRTLLKRNGIETPSRVEKGWGKTYRSWLRGLTGVGGPMGAGARVALGSLLRQMEALEEELGRLDEEVTKLSKEERYAGPAKALTAEKGVGMVIAMVYLTEMGDLKRFGNRKAVGSYLGLTPSSDETGEQGEKKGHITHQGPYRVRRVLCQGVWSRVRTDEQTGAAYERIAAKNPKHKKIAVVAMMRRLAVRLWRVGREAQAKSGSFAKAA
jgi:transposase